MSQLPDADSRERFTRRLEAFSDLVFGFSLSLLATRLDVPARVEDIFDSARWFAIIGTFALVCRFWLEHYRIFRHRFVAGMFDATVNFIFLFAIAVLPYSVQTLLRFGNYFPSFALYVCDGALILLTLSVLRVRGLRQRRGDQQVQDRLRDWRRSLLQGALTLFLGVLLFALQRHGGTVESGLRYWENYILGIFAGAMIGVRLVVRRLPAFLT
ncbi:MAG: DUF1211 domain-containing protein [Chthoniobacterales bacterium]|nr:DUF1211 domain-containing protein [Chthoniobacterales bacterium]